MSNNRSMIVLTSSFNNWLYLMNNSKECKRWRQGCAIHLTRKEVSSASSSGFVCSFSKSKHRSASRKRPWTKSLVLSAILDTERKFKSNHTLRSSFSKWERKWALLRLQNKDITSLCIKEYNTLNMLNVRIEWKKSLQVLNNNIAITHERKIIVIWSEIAFF